MKRERQRDGAREHHRRCRWCSFCPWPGCDRTAQRLRSSSRFTRPCRLKRLHRLCAAARRQSRGTPTAVAPAAATSRSLPETRQMHRYSRPSQGQGHWQGHWHRPGRQRVCGRCLRWGSQPCVATRRPLRRTFKGVKGDTSEMAVYSTRVPLIYSSWRDHVPGPQVAAPHRLMESSCSRVPTCQGY